MAIFWGSSGKTYTLGNTPLATGGEGNIFVVQSEANFFAGEENHTNDETAAFSFDN